MSNKMWGGRFATSPDAIMTEINASIGFDHRLAAQDIRGSLAHVAMLAEAGVVTRETADAISRGLNQVQAEIESGVFTFSRALEDIHMNVESRLAEIIGPEAALFVVAFKQASRRIAAQNLREFPAQVIDVLNATIRAACAEGGDQMGSIADKQDAIVHKLSHAPALERVQAHPLVLEVD